VVKTIGNVQKDAQVRAVASGTLSNGDTVIVNSDGTVSSVEGSDEATGTPVVAVAEYATYASAAYDVNAQKVVIAYQANNDSGKGKAVVGTVSGTSISFGTPVVFENANTTFISAVYDANAQKIVIAYRDGGNVNSGTAIVGTVSGTSISFGSPTVFESVNSTFISASYDNTNNKVVIAYRDNGNSDYGTAIVGTVSGTSISFGTATVFASTTVDEIGSTYDSNAQRVVIAYRNELSSPGNNGETRVGTVSGTSISFGSAVTFAVANSRRMSLAYDSNAQKVVLAYSDHDDSQKGKALVGTVSGTSISFGSVVTWETDSTTYKAAVYDANAQKVVIAYSDGGNSGAGTLAIGTVSGTSISFDTPIVYSSNQNEYIGATYDSVDNNVIVAYRDGSNSSELTSAVYSAGSTNLTSDNFIGFADGAYADTQSAVINTTCSVARNQTSLTAGQKYYVQTNGALSETAGDPSVEAGTAISSTEILVKG